MMVYGRGVRLAFAWVATLALVGGYFALTDEDLDPNLTAEVEPEPRSAGDVRPDIVEVVPGEPNPGQPVIVRYEGGTGGVARAFLGKQELETVQARPGELVVRLPAEAREGRGKLRVAIADERSKPYEIRIKPISRRKYYRNVIGGLALLVFGLRTLSRGSRAFAGQRSRVFFARLGRRLPRAFAVGAAVGALTQFASTAAGMVVGLVESRLVGLVPAAALLVGAQLGSAVAPSVMGLLSAREGLLLAAVGVVWLGLARDRRSESVAKVLLGCGLLFYGFHLLRVGFEPLVVDPAFGPYIDGLRLEGPAGWAKGALIGVLLAAVLQGPAPVFALTLGLLQTSGRLELPGALAILGGAWLGAPLATIVLAWSAGAEARRLARLHVALGLLGTALFLVLVPVALPLADAWVSGQPSEVVFGKKVLLPRAAAHLVTAYALVQAVTSLVLLAALPVVARLLPLRAKPERPVTPIGDPVIALKRGLLKVLDAVTRGLDATLALALDAHRTSGVVAEHALGAGRADLESLVAGPLRSSETSPHAAALKEAVLACVGLERASEELLRGAERFTDRTLGLGPSGELRTLPVTGVEAIRAAHALLREGLVALRATLHDGQTLDVEAARAREISLNVLELDGRRALARPGSDDPEAVDAVTLRLHIAELLSAYESVGNQVYRVAEALAPAFAQTVPLAAV